MIITRRTTVAFKLPEEWRGQRLFEKDHADWEKDEDTQYAYYTDEHTYHVKTGTEAGHES